LLNIFLHYGETGQGMGACGRRDSNPHAPGGRRF
jgi:hypothetical protein